MAFIHDASFSFPKMQQHNLDTGRVYSVSEGPQQGLVYPSITTVLHHKEKPFLQAWIKRVGVEEAEHARNKAGIRGDILHQLAEDYLKNRPPSVTSIPPHIAELWRRLRPWIKQHITTVYAQEQDVFSHRLAVAGRTDLLALIDGELTIGDFKNSLKPKKDESWVEDYFIQGTFYCCAVYEITGILPKKIVFPVVSPEGIQVFTTTPMKHFVALQERIDTFYTDGGKKILDIIEEIK